MNKAVRKLHTDLSHLKSAEGKVTADKTAVKNAGAAEKAALQKIADQEKAIIDAFVQSPPTDPAQVQKLLGQLVQLGASQVTTQDKFQAQIAKDQAGLKKDAKTVGADRTQALKDLKPAEYQLSLKDTNAARAELGLKPLKTPVRESWKPGSWKPGPGTLYGADTSSSYQTDAQFQASIAGKQFTAIKATDGLSANQGSFKARWNELGQRIKDGKMKLRVAYHYLEPGESGVAQAQKFLQTVGVHGKLPAGTRLALDWEAGALNQPSVLRDAANYIHKVTGIWPLVYCQASEASRARSIVPHAPLWEAAVADNAGDPLPTSMRNRNVPFFQYAWKPWDLDQFNGNLKALEKFAGY